MTVSFFSLGTLSLGRKPKAPISEYVLIFSWRTDLEANGIELCSVPPGIIRLDSLSLGNDRDLLYRCSSFSGDTLLPLHPILQEGCRQS